MMRRPPGVTDSAAAHRSCQVRSPRGSPAPAATRRGRRSRRSRPIAGVARGAGRACRRALALEVLTRDGQPRKASSDRGLDALGIPAERGEPMTAARRAVIGRWIGARAQRAAERAPVAGEGQGHAAIGAAKHGAALVAASADVRRLTMRTARRPRRDMSSMARVSGRVSGWFRRMPRVSAVMTSGQEAGGASGRTIRPWRACHQLSADGVAESRSRRPPSSSARRGADRANAAAGRRAACGPDRARRSAPAPRAGAKAPATPTACRPRLGCARGRPRTRPGGAPPRRRRCRAGAHRAAAPSARPPRDRA